MPVTTTDVPAKVAAAHARLDALPKGLASEAFKATILHKAHVDAAIEALAADLEGALQRVATATAAVQAGDSSPAARQELVNAAAAAAALAAAQGLVASPPLDAAAIQPDLTAAAQSMGGMSWPTEVLALNWLEEQAEWSSYYRGLEPPVPTDADRAAAVSWREATDRLAVLRKDLQFMWADSMINWSGQHRNLDPLALLASTPGWAAALDAVSDVVNQANAAIQAANTARSAAGLNWRHP